MPINVNESHSGRVGAIVNREQGLAAVEKFFETTLGAIELLIGRMRATEATLSHSGVSSGIGDGG
jgi:hypothetical protein